jgi:hypothetical protein
MHNALLIEIDSFNYKGGTMEQATYEDADQMYRVAIHNQSNAFINMRPIDVDRFRVDLSKVVAALHEAYKSGNIETIEGLPSAEAVLTFRGKPLTDLHNTLRDLYFPPVVERPELYETRCAIR